MSSWLALLIGLVAGLLFGIISGRKNYENCRDLIAKLKREIKEKEKDLTSAQEKVEELAHQLDEVESEPSATKQAVETAAAAPETSVSSDLAPEEFVSKAAPVVTEASAEEAAEGIEGRTAPETSVSSDLAPEGFASKAAPVVTEASAEEAAEEIEGRAAPEAPAEKSEEAVAEIATVGTEAAEEHFTECPQKLARIHGVGRVYETRLYQAGIGTYWQVAITPAARLAEIFGLQDFQGVDVKAIQEAARQLAIETGTTGKLWNGSEPDDIEDLPGIGKVYEGRLYDAGVCTWGKLASLTPDELAAIVKAPKWNQPDFEAWIAYAKGRLSA